MKVMWMALLLSSLAATAGAQTREPTLDVFNARRQRTNRIGMIVLAS
jgi:hypothetical protein